LCLHYRRYEILEILETGGKIRAAGAVLGVLGASWGLYTIIIYIRCWRGHQGKGKGARGKAENFAGTGDSKKGAFR